MFPAPPKTFAVKTALPLTQTVEVVAVIETDKAAAGATVKVVDIAAQVEPVTVAVTR